MGTAIDQKRKLCLAAGSLCLLASLSASCNKKTVAKPPAIPNQPTRIEPNARAPSDATEQLKPFVPSGNLLRIARSVTVRLSNDEFDGSGVVIAQDGSDVYVLTVAHAAREAISQVEFFERGSSSFVGSNPTILHQDDEKDLAILRVKIPLDAEIQPVRISRPSDEELGGERPKNQRVDILALSVGCGNGRTPEPLSERIVAEGVYSLPIRDQRVKRLMWETESAQEGGRSGGPLLDVNGNLLGVALGKYDDRGFYAHICEISHYLIDTDLEGLLLWAEVSN